MSALLWIVGGLCFVALVLCLGVFIDFLLDYLKITERLK